MASKHPLARFVPRIAGAVIVVLVVGALIWFIRSMQDKPDDPKRQVAQVVKLIRPPPPPPEEPPPPPPPEEKIEEPLPQETPDEAPPDEPPNLLNMDAEAVAGSDNFNMVAGRGGGPTLGGGGGAIFGWYTSRIKDQILEMLSEDERIRRKKYQVTVSVWVDEKGKVERIQLRSTSGDREIDDAIETRLARVRQMQEPPPLEMPQPVTLRIVSR